MRSTDLPLARWLFLLIAALALLAGTASAQQPKVIQDPAEYNAYMAALNLADPAKKGVAMEAFVSKYPRSVVKTDALEQAMTAYRQADDKARLEAVARTLLEADPRNLQALAVVTVLERVRANQGDAAALAQLRGHAEEGLRELPGWKAAGFDEAELRKVKNQMSAVFNGAAGFVALQAKDYAKAREAYLKAVKLDPGNMQDLYQLAVAELQSSPLDPDGFWHIAKAIAIAEAQKNGGAVDSMVQYGKAKYIGYHGGDDGWDQMVAQAAKQAALPADFAQSVKPAPTPPEIAVKAVAQNDPAALSFSDWEYVLGYRDASPANKAAADKVWTAIQQKQKGGKLKLHVKVIAATLETIDAAVTADNAKANKTDLHVTMAKPMAKAPAPGSAVDVVGVLSDYTAKPFIFLMTEGEM